MEDVFLRVGMESLLGETEVRPRQTRVTAQKGSDFLFDYWIGLKFL